MILYSKWLSLPLQTRNKIAGVLGIERKGGVEVFNDTIKNDGYLIKDLEDKLSVSNLQRHFNSTEDITILFGYLIDLADGKIPQVPVKIEGVGAVEILPTEEAEVAAKALEERSHKEAPVNTPLETPRKKRVKKVEATNEENSTQ